MYIYKQGCVYKLNSTQETNKIQVITNLICFVENGTRYYSTNSPDTFWVWPVLIIICYMIRQFFHYLKSIWILLKPHVCRSKFSSFLVSLKFRSNTTVADIVQVKANTSTETERGTALRTALRDGYPGGPEKASLPYLENDLHKSKHSLKILSWRTCKPPQ